MAHGQRLDALQSAMRDRALRDGIMFVDIDRAFELSAAGVLAQHGDAIHWSAAGFDTAYQVIEDCFEQVYSTADGYCNDNGTPGDGVRDGTCEERAGDGATGALGDPCDEDADCALYQCDLLNPDWKGAMAGLWGFDYYCSGGTNPYDDCADNDDCFGGTCMTGSSDWLADRSGRGLTLTHSTAATGTLGTYTATSLDLGNGAVDLSATNPAYLYVDLPADWLAGKSASWGGWVNFTTANTQTSIPANWIIKTQPNVTGGSTNAGTNNILTGGFGLSVFNVLDTEPDVVCYMGSTSVTDRVTTVTWQETGEWHHLACVYDAVAQTLTAYLDGVPSGSPTTGVAGFSGDPGALVINATSTSYDGGFYGDEFFVIHAAFDDARMSRVVSGSVPGDLVDCDSFAASYYTECTQNSDCGTTQICDTADSATDDPHCLAANDGAEGAGCCMGYNSTRAGGESMSACNAIP